MKIEFQNRNHISRNCNNLAIPVLPELPLPTSLPNAVNTKSLLDNPKLVQEVEKLLNSKDKPLVEKLVQALRQSSTEHM